MHKQQITIEVDIPDGYEATGEFRLPDESREFWLNPTARLCFPHNGQPTCDGPRLILRKKWQCPEGVTANWLAVDDDGYIRLFDEEPKLEGGDWYDGNGWMSYIHPSHVSWSSPPRGTKHKNPNAK